MDFARILKTENRKLNTAAEAAQKILGPLGPLGHLEIHNSNLLLCSPARIFICSKFSAWFHHADPPPPGKDLAAWRSATKHCKSRVFLLRQLGEVTWRTWRLGEVCQIVHTFFVSFRLPGARRGVFFVACPDILPIYVEFGIKKSEH